jgi:tripartite-type tricarboxylate transporter receptor subunit TctC
VPENTPVAIVNTLRKAVQEAVQTGQIEPMMDQRGMIFDYRDIAEFKKFAKEDGDRMLKVIRAIGKLN